MLSNILNVSYLLTTYGYWGIFLIILIESGVFFFLPGDSLLFAAGLLSSLGSMRLVPILILAIVAAFFGNVIGYEIGTHIEKLRRYSIFRKLLRQEHIDAAKDFFAKHGRPALLLARFVPAVRTFTPWVAGLSRMERKVFYTWSGAGAIVWVFIMTLAGYFLGKAFPGIERYLTEVILAIVVISILPGVFGWWRGRRSRAGE